jgi:diamine N-acetyltransferase
MKYLLRDLKRSDLPTLNRWRNDRAVTDHLGGNHRFVSEEVDGQWFDNYLKSRNNNVRLAICDAHSEELAGVVYLLDIDWINRSAEFAIQIGAAERRGGGLGTWATAEMLQHGFRDLNLHRIHLTVLEQNKSAIHLYEKAGFVLEGRLRQAAFKNGRYADLLVMSLLADEFGAGAPPKGNSGT